MPELPEVQTTVDGINSRVRGLLISDAWTDYGGGTHIGSNTIKDPAFFSFFKKHVVGARIKGSRRRGKNILVDLSNGKTILIHMKMTGHVMHGAYRKLNRKDHQGEWWRPSEAADAHLNDPFNRFIHFTLSFSDGTHLVLSDMRKFAKVTMVDTAAAHDSEHLRHHGPEPMNEEFGVNELITAMSRKPRGSIKTVLMDHTIIAGIGNIYSDEILWRSGIHPLEKTENVSRKQWAVVLKALKSTLQKGIDFGGDSMSDYRNIEGKRGLFQERHAAYRRTGLACGKKGCRGKIQRLVIGGRSAHFCDTHQKLLKGRG